MDANERRAAMTLAGKLTSTDSVPNILNDIQNVVDGITPIASFNSKYNTNFGVRSSNPIESFRGSMRRVAAVLKSGRGRTPFQRQFGQQITEAQKPSPPQLLPNYHIFTGRHGQTPTRFLVLQPPNYGFFAMGQHTRLDYEWKSIQNPIFTTYWTEYRVRCNIKLDNFYPTYQTILEVPMKPNWAEELLNYVKYIQAKYQLRRTDLNAARFMIAVEINKDSDINIPTTQGFDWDWLVPNAISTWIGRPSEPINNTALLSQMEELIDKVNETFNSNVPEERYEYEDSVDYVITSISFKFNISNAPANETIRGYFL